MLCAFSTFWGCCAALWSALPRTHLKSPSPQIAVSNTADRLPLPALFLWFYCWTCLGESSFPLSVKCFLAFKSIFPQANCCSIRKFTSPFFLLPCFSPPRDNFLCTLSVPYWYHPRGDGPLAGGLFFSCPFSPLYCRYRRTFSRNAEGVPSLFLQIGDVGSSHPAAF